MSSREDVCLDVIRGSLKYPFGDDQTMQIDGNFEGNLVNVHCLGW